MLMTLDCYCLPTNQNDHFNLSGYTTFTFHFNEENGFFYAMGDRL